MGKGVNGGFLVNVGWLVAVNVRVGKGVHVGRVVAVSSNVGLKDGGTANVAVDVGMIVSVIFAGTQLQNIMGKIIRKKTRFRFMFVSPFFNVVLLSHHFIWDNGGDAGQRAMIEQS